MSTYYPPKTYNDGDVRTGAEQTNQEQRIDSAVGNIETRLSTLDTQTLLIKGASGNPIADLVTLNYLSRYAQNPGHTHDASSIAGFPTHTHPYTQITNPPWALQTDFNNLAGAGWPGSGTNVMGVNAGLSALITDVANLKGVGHTALQTMVRAYSLIQTGISPGHLHYATDISGLSGIYVTQQEFNAIKGGGWTATETIHSIYLALTSGTSPGHKHVAAEITDLPDLATQAELDAVKGNSYAGATVQGNADAIAAIKGNCWNSSITMCSLYGNILRLFSDVSTLYIASSTLSEKILDAQGTGYRNTTTSPVNITGVVLTMPSAGGTPKGTYTLVFTYSSTSYSTLRWAGGATRNIDAGSTTYTLYDSSGNSFVNATVTTGSLPVANKQDVIVVTPENIHDLYTKYAGVAPGGSDSVVGHVTHTHGDALITVPVITANGSNRVLTVSNARANIGGTLHPATGTMTDSVTLDTTTATGGTLTASQLKVDLISIDTTDSITYTRGTASAIARGIITFPAVPANCVAMTYVVVPGNRTYLAQSDILGVKVVMDWQAQWARISDALDYHGSDVDAEYGYIIEQPRTLKGVVTTIHRLPVFQQPTNNSNVTLSSIDDGTSVPHYNTSAQGLYSLVYTNSTKLLTWGGGTGVDVTGGGTFTLLDSTGTTGVKAVVTTPLLGSDTTDTNLEVGWRPTPGPARYTLAWNAANKTLTFDSGTATSIAAGPGFYELPGSNGKYIGVYVQQVNHLPTTNTTDSIRVMWNGLTELDLKIEQAMRLITETVVDTTPRTMVLGRGLTGGTFRYQFGSVGPEKYLEYDSTSDTVVINANLALKGGKTYRHRKLTNNTDHEPYRISHMVAQTAMLSPADFSSASAFYYDFTNKDLMADPLNGNTWRAYVGFICSGSASAMAEGTIFYVFKLPPDFAEFPASGADASTTGVFVKAYCDDADKFKNKITVEVFKNGTASPIATSLDNVGDFTVQIAGSSLASAGFVAGDELVVRARCYTRLSRGAWCENFRVVYRATPTT